MEATPQMNKLIFISLILFSFSCGAAQKYKECFKQNGVSYQVESDTTLCPDPMETESAMEVVADIAECKREVFKGYDVVFIDEQYMELGSQRAVGATYTDSRTIYIAKTPYPINILRHEFFHVALLATTGNSDYYHADPRWNEVN